MPLDSVTDDLERDAIKAQLANFGQTPPCLFMTAHPAKHACAIPAALAADTLLPVGEIGYCGKDDGICSIVALGFDVSSGAALMFDSVHGRVFKAPATGTKVHW